MNISLIGKKIFNHINDLTKSINKTKPNKSFPSFHFHSSPFLLSSSHLFRTSSHLHIHSPSSIHPSILPSCSRSSSSSSPLPLFLFLLLLAIIIIIIILFLSLFLFLLLATSQCGVSVSCGLWGWGAVCGRGAVVKHRDGVCVPLFDTPHDLLVEKRGSHSSIHTINHLSIHPFINLLIASINHSFAYLWYLILLCF